MKKKVIAVILTLAMAVAYMPDYGISAAAATPDQDQVQTEESIDDGTGGGSAEDPADVSDGNKDTSKGSEAENASDDPAEEFSDAQDQDGSEQEEDTRDQEEQEEASDTDSDGPAGGAEFIRDHDTEAADVQGKAAESKASAEEALEEETDLTSEKIEKVVKRLFAAPEDEEGDEGEDPDGEPADDPSGGGEEDQKPPRQGDGTFIENVSAKWITADTVDNGDAGLLYRRPGNIESQSVRLQINYALSGEHNYDPGDITITVPAHIFKNRNGKDCGTLIIPYPEDPSRRGDFNWKLVGDNYVLTNTKRMSSATKGYIQFQIEGLSPQELVDMETSAPFTANLEIVTHKGNLLGLESNPLTAQFDTEARLTDVQKRSQRVTRVKADQIPANQRIEGEETYIKVDWYVWGTTAANTYYTIKQTDAIPQNSVSESRLVVSDNYEKYDENKHIRLSDANEQYPKKNYQVGDTVVLQREEDLKGFVIGGSSSETDSITKDNVYRGYSSGRGGYYYFSTAYPASQFKPDVEYTFHNTINYTVTEVDPEVTENTNPNVQDVDPKLVTGQDKVATAQTTWHYSDPKWINPGGHYMVYKNGNDDTKEGNRTHKSTYTYSDLHRGGDGYYGIYPSAINQLQDQYKGKGEDGSVRLSYTINNVGYTLPWMYNGGVISSEGEEHNPAMIIGNYDRPITLTSTDTGISIGRNSAKLAVFDDYTFEEVEFPNTPYVYRGSPQNVNPDGTWIALDAGDGTFNYASDSNKANWPDIKLQIKRNGEWEDWASASWKSGSRVITLKSGATQTGGIVKVPEDTETFRTIVTLKNTEAGVDAEEALQAGINYDVRAVINLKSTEEMNSLIEEAFTKSRTPAMSVYNGVNMLIERADVPKNDKDRQIHSIDRDGYDSIRGYTTDTSVYPYKSSTQKLKEVDYEARTILIHYEARVEERSVIAEKKTWQQAVDDGRLATDTHCTWRDLLPKGVTPDLSTIRLRSGDKVTDAYTVENYKGKGRTLLIVEADLTPTPTTYRSGDMTYYEDVPTIRFDAVYDFESLVDYGDDLHNVIAYESGNKQLGSVPGYSGEPDDPTLSQHKNVSTEDAFNERDEAEKRIEEVAMSDLDKDPAHDGWENFVYAGAWTKIDILSAARTSLYKDVQVNNDGIFSEGTYYKDIYDDPPKEATDGGRMRTVYEGGQYTYRLRIMSDPDTISTDLIMYDSLEDFEPSYDPEDPYGSDNDWIDAREEEDPDFHWQGMFRGVDTSQLEELGCAPVVYYCTQNLKLSNEDDPIYATPTDAIDLDSDIWVKADDYEGDLSDVKSIAIDCSTASDTADDLHKDKRGHFRIQPMESIVALVRMQAPSGDKARDLISMTGHWGESAQAYNNAYLLCTSIDKDTGDSDVGNFVRRDYTKVGLKEYSLKATKKWNDDSDRDGKRLDEVTFRLFANGEDTGEYRVLNAAKGETEVVFEHIPYTDENGEKIHYTIKEDDIPEYTASYEIDGETFAYTNTHVPERTAVNGEKTWEGDEESDRPASIDVVLYGNGKKLQTKTVKPDSQGKWAYSFTNLYKYENGKEIEYTVEETRTPNTGDKLDSYVPEVDGFDIANTFHPFGDLKVSKHITGTTEVSEDQQFTFTFEFSSMQEQEDGTTEEGPVFDEFDYEVLDENGEPVLDDEGEPLTGKVATNGEIKIKGGQSIHVKEIPEYVKYKVTEKDADGFTITTKSGDSGTIEPNETAEAEFTNAYSASGQYNPKVGKLLKNRTLTKYQFSFELYEITEGEEGEEVEEIRSTAANDAASEVTERDDGTVESSEATATFGRLRYTQEDHGKTFRYRIKEIDKERDGYTYSTDIYELDVKVTDNGDGTLKIEPSYKDAEGNPVQTAVFENTYQAKGNTTLLAWKSLPVRALEDDEFTFELLDEEGSPVENEDGSPVTVTNKKDGTVTFDPAKIKALNYDEKDIGKTYHYALREVKGDDDTVIYDDTVFGYAVKIVDNGDGTLYPEQTLATPVFDKEDPDKIVRWETEGAKLPIFENDLEDGGFSITKTTVDSEEADPTQPFRFRVRLIGDKVTDDIITGYTISEAGGNSPSPAPAPAADADADDEEAAPVSDAQDIIVNGPSSVRTNDTVLRTPAAGAPAKAAGETVLYSGKIDALTDTTLWNIMAVANASTDSAKTYWTDVNRIVNETGDKYKGVDWRITSDGELIIGKEGETQYFYPWRARTADGYPNVSANSVPTNLRKAGMMNYTWHRYRSQVKTVRFEGTVYGQGDMNGIFQNMTNLQTADVTGFNTSEATGLGYFFDGCSRLTSIKGLNTLDTSKIIWINQAFGNCSSLKEIDVSNFNIPTGYSFQNMFSGCSNVEYLDLSGFDVTTRPRYGLKDIIAPNPAETTPTLQNFFSSCSKLNTVVLGDKFSFKGYGTNTTYYSLLPTPPNGQRWVRQEGPVGSQESYTSAQLRDNYTSSWAGTWVWSGKTFYTVHFLADEAAGGISPVRFIVAEGGKLPANTFQKFGYDFDHWVVTDKNGVPVTDGSGAEITYTDKQTLPANAYEMNDHVYLKAVFVPHDTSVDMQDGEFEITLRAGEKATFDNIPAGTAYQIYEETPKGWILVEQSGVSGTIQPLITSEADFVNKYEPGTASVQLYATKTLDYRAAKEGAYTFVLKENGAELQRKQTMDGGFIQFDPITYKEANIGTHTYTIEEVDPEDDTIDYDTHKETVTVTVAKDGDDLTATAEYDSDGAKFSNMTRPGNLKLTKAAEGSTPANADDEFTFKITLNNADGMPLGSGDAIYWYTEKNTGADAGDAGRAAPNAVRFNAPKLTSGETAADTEVKKTADTQTAGDADKEEDAGKAESTSPKKSSAAPVKAPAADDIANGTYRGCDWRITSAGVLILGNGDTQTLSGNGSWPWRSSSYINQIKSVRFDGTVEMTGSASSMFNGCSNLTTFDSTGFDPSSVTNFSYMFYNCSRLTTVNADGWVSDKAVYLNCMFANCGALTKVVTTNWDTSKVLKFWQLFYQCRNLEEINTSSWVIVNVDDGRGKDNSTDLNDMFTNCYKLKDIDTSKWGQSGKELRTYEGWSWFYNCNKIRRLDLTNVSKMVRGYWSGGSFSGLNNLSVFKVGKNTFNNSSAQFPSGTWKRLSTGEVKTGAQWNSSWNGASMADTYVRLTATMYKNGEMVIDWGYDENRTDEIVNTYVLTDTSSAPWYSDSFKTSITKVTINTEIAPTYTRSWFDGMTKLKQIEGLEDLKMDNLTNMQYMFRNCTSLDSIYLPPDFSFKGNNITNVNLQAILPTPPSNSIYTGKWIREDEGAGPYTPAELRDNYAASMTGKWVWEVDDSVAMVAFDANGGYTSASRLTLQAPLPDVDMPDEETTSRPGYYLSGWTLNEDGTGTVYRPGSSYSDIAELGKWKTLYAQWAEEGALARYKVEHYVLSSAGGSYILKDSDILTDRYGAAVSPEEKEYEGYMIKDHDSEYTLPAAGEEEMVIRYYYDPFEYDVAFDGNGSTSGQMNEKQHMLGSKTETLKANTYQKKGSIFTGWNTDKEGNGRSFVDKDKVKNLTNENGGTVTLYAQWMSNEDNKLEPSNGEIIVKCKAGETIVIPDLPAGTTYTIEEIDNPAGWSQKGKIEGNGGTITANVTDHATATNQYKASGQARLNAHKVLEGADIEEGQFTFQLLNEDDEVIDTKTNGEADDNEQVLDDEDNVVDNPYYQTSLVEFDPLNYTQDDIGKTYTYTIREAADDSKPVNYDSLEAKVLVHIEDAGAGNLDVKVTYQNTDEGLEPIFENSMMDSELRIMKSIVGASDEARNDEFTFTVDLTDIEGNPVEGSFDTVIGDTEGTISSGDKVTLKGGEVLLITGLPQGIQYEVTEEEKEHWEQTEAEGASGTLEPGETSEVSFENTYHEPEKKPYNATGEVQFKASKEVEGGLILEDDNFTFELTDEQGEAIQSKSCDDVTGDDGNVSESEITFDKITYDINDLEYDEKTIEDNVRAAFEAALAGYQSEYDEAKAAYDQEHADDPDAKKFPDFDRWLKTEKGYTQTTLMQELDEYERQLHLRENTFIYYVREVAGDDPDVTYDKTRYYYKVHAVDQGDGTIKTDVTCYRMGDEDTEVNDITFTNIKTTQVKVYKKWVDNDDQDGYRPTKEEFAEKIHLMAAVGDADPEEVKDAEPTISEDADGNLTVLYVDLPAYKDGVKIVYTVKEDSIEHYEPKGSVDEVEDGGTLMNVHTPDKVSLEITKKMPDRIDLPENGENATVVFKITGKNRKDKVIYENHVGMTFDEEAGTFETVVLENLPADMTVTVEEVYGGNYEPKEGKIIVERADLEEDEDGNMKWTVEFENTPDTPGFGSGIVNKYENTEDGVKYKKEADK